MSDTEQPDDVELLKILTSSPSLWRLSIVATLQMRSHVSLRVSVGLRKMWPTLCRPPFLAVLVSAGKFNPNFGSPRAWLFTIARNEARGQGRSLGRREGLRLRIRGSVLLSRDDPERLAELIDAERAVAELEETLRR